MKQNKKCDICNITEINSTILGGNRYGFNYLCKKHYTHFYRHGKALDRTRFDKNEIIEYKDFAEVIIYDKDYIKICSTIIDLDDVELIKKYKWCTDSRYIKTTIKGKILQIHRLILNAKEGEVVDHIDRNKLNNRKSNLRIVNNSENGVNSSTRIDNKSGVIGVHYDKFSEKWVSKLHFNNKQIFYKMFIIKEEAIKARLRAELLFLGEFAPQKHLFEKYGITIKK